MLDRDTLKELKTQALATDTQDKKSRILLLEYALVVGRKDLLEALSALKFKPVENTKKAWRLIEQKYFMFYSSSNTRNIIQETDKYGVDFRNVFNQTPLMSASRLGNVTLIKGRIGD